MSITTFITEKGRYLQGYIIGIYKCKNCGETFEICGILRSWHHCPNCGIKISNWENNQEE